MKLSIRRATPNDIGAIADMSAALHVESDVGYPEIDETEAEKMMFQILDSFRNPECLFLVAFDGKKPIGFLAGHIAFHHVGKPQKVGVVEQIYVVPEKRGGPVGFGMIKEAVKVAMQHGVEAFEAVGVPGKTDQRWAKLGFRPYATYMHLDKESMLDIAFPGMRKVTPLPQNPAQEGETHASV